jgi:hypothetical protein
MGRGIIIFLISVEMRNLEKHNLVVFTAMGFDLDKFKSGRLYGKHPEAAWILETISAFT